MQAGQQVTPTIRLVRPLEQGAMGSVWVAENLALRTPVAVKFIAPAHAQDPDFIRRFRQEAQAAAQLRSPYAAQVHDHGVTEDGVPYIVMELLEGETLQSRMKRRGRLPLHEVVRFVGQATKALSKAHRLGIIHRDIKPENLFVLDVEGEPFLKVLDFGLAKQLHADAPGVTSTSATLGTPLYMSPEQFLSAKQVDHRADLWSLAVVAYQALTGRLPFGGDGVGAVAVAVHAGEFAPPSALRPGLPHALDEWMARALSRDPAARFASANEMAASLEQAAGGPSRRQVSPVRRPDPKRLATADMVAVPPRHDKARPQAAAARAHDGRDRVTVSAMSELKIGSRRIEIVKKHIVKAGTEAIVSTADPVLSPYFDPICQAIHRAAGPELVEMTRLHGRCVPGGAVITGAGRIPPPTRFIIHAVGPKYSQDRDAECTVLLRSAYDMSLRLAEERGVRSIAFPAISTGAYGYPTAKAAAIALRAVANYLATTARSVEVVVFVLITDVSYNVFAKTLATLSPR